jgi:hypothetical protein
MMTIQYQFLDTQRRSEAPGRLATTPHQASEQLEYFVECLARPSAASRLTRWTALTPPASVSLVRGDIPAALVSRGAAVGRLIGSGLR